MTMTDGIDALFSDPKVDVVIAALHEVPGWPTDTAADEAFVRSLIAEFPTTDLAEATRAWATWLLDNPQKGKVNWRSRFRNWCKNGLRYEREGRDRRATGSGGRVGGVGTGRPQGHGGHGTPTTPGTAAQHGETSRGLEQW
jgi:hypothetical protein